MLTISKPLSSGQAQTYHAKEFTSAEQNYWKQGDTILGEWQGRMAEQYGLAGGIDAHHFARLSEGQNPLTGEQLVRHRNGQEYTTADGTTVKPVEHRAGWDATFSAPKSVSLTALVGGDDRVREAHRQAVTTALTELERYTQARIGGNHAAETTGKFVAAKFEHDTARPVDGYAAPQLHTHAVIFNMTERADGSTRAVQPQSYFDSQQFATAVYQSELMHRLAQLGYEITPGRSGAPEIKGYTQEYLDASSPRSQQIREYLEKSGFAGPEAAQIAAHTTRDKKEIHTPSEVLAAHRQVAAEFGNQADQVVQEARDRANSMERKPLPEAERVQEAVNFAKSRNFEREAVTDERDIMRDALRRGMGDLTYSQVRGHFEQRVTSGEFQITPGQKHETGRHFTTREAITEELSTIKQMQQGRQAAEPIMRQDDAAAHARSREFLNPAQQRAIEEVLTSQDRIHGLQGLAGSGKTSALSNIREGAEKNGYAVEGFAPTSRAAGQLRDAGIPADTLQGFLARGGVERNAGDHKQRIEAIAKDYVARPENTLIVSPDNASRRDINDAVRAELQNSGALSKEDHPMTVLTQRSELTSADRNWAALYQPADVLYYTRGSKELGIERGTYATVVSTNPKDNLLTVERQDGQHVTYNPERLHGIAAYREIVREFSEGDRVQFTVSKSDMDVKNRDLGTIERIEGASVSVRLDGEKERILTFDSSQMRHFDHGYAVTSHSSQGLTTDRVLVHMDTTAHPELINTRFAYVSVSRASQDARIYTNDVSTLAERLSTDISKTSAVQFETPHGEHHQQPRPSPQPKEHTMTNSNEQTPEEQKRPESELTPVAITLQAITETDQRHYAPLHIALPNESEGYEWKRETGDIQSYQHTDTAGWLHIDPQGQFYDRHAQPIERDHALEHAAHAGLGNNEVSQSPPIGKDPVGTDQGLSL